MSNSVLPHRWQPTRLPCPWDSPGKNAGVGCHFFLQCMKVKSESEVAQSCPSLHDPMTATYQASPSMGLARQEYWSGLPLPSPNLQAAAAAAKSLQLCPTLCDPIDGIPPGSPVPGILQARTRVGCHFLLQCMKLKSESEVAQSCPTLSDPLDCSPWAPSMGFSKQEYWSGVPSPSPNLEARFQDRCHVGATANHWLGAGCLC